MISQNDTAYYDDRSETPRSGRCAPLYLLNKLYEKTASLITHGWFCTTCLSFVLVSSIPRIFVAFDVLATVYLYIDSVDSPPGSPDTSALVMNDLKSYSFGRSLSDFLLVTLLRAAVCFRDYAYSQRRPGCESPLANPFLVASVSSSFVCAKLAFLTKPRNRRALLFSLASSWVSLLLFALFRRKGGLGFKAVAASDGGPSKAAAPADLEAQSRLLAAAEPGGRREAPLEISSAALGLVADNKAAPGAKSFATRVVEAGVASVETKVFRFAEPSEPAVAVSVFVLCGLFDFEASWAQLAATLGREGAGVRKVVLVDLFRKATLPVEGEGEGSRRRAIAKLLRKTIPKSSARRRTVLVAHSVSAPCALAFAAANPGRVSGLVLVSPTSTLPSVVSALLNARLDRELAAKLLDAELKHILPGLCFGSRGDSSRKDVPSGGFLPGRKGLSASGLLDLLKLGEEMAGWEKPGFGAEIEAGELLVVCGADDRVDATAGRSLFLDLGRGRSLERLDGCGHLPHLERRAEFSAILASFLLKN